MKNALFLLCLIFTGCGSESSYSQPSNTFQDDSNNFWDQELPYVDFILDVGNLQGDGDFRFVNDSLKTSEDIHTLHVQIGAFMIDTGEHNPELLRVHFQSDYTEWVNFDEILSPVYPSQEACEEESSYCEGVNIIHGESGLVDSHEGLVGIKNTHCRYMGEPYTYRVNAWVETLETYPPSIISKTESIVIECEVVDRGE